VGRGARALSDVLASGASSIPDDEATVHMERPTLAVHIVLRDIRSSKIYEATAPRVRVGRSADCEVALTVSADDGVSRVHCEFGLDGYTSIVVRDSGSRNGTLLNGHVVTEDTRVSNGQAIALGDTGPTLLIERVALKTIPAPKL
jgi:pSer/pThr/pTyr-binding forkhead associated (FHA) protein